MQDRVESAERKGRQAKNQEKRDWNSGDVCQCRKNGEPIIVELIQVNGGKEDNPRWEVKEITSGRLFQLFEKRLRPCKEVKAIVSEEKSIEPTGSIEVKVPKSIRPKERDEESSDSDEEELRKKWKEERKAFREKKQALVKQFRQLSEGNQKEVEEFIEKLSAKN
eukprot:TRINITY_DN528_c0_g1_i2.p1 TRINITY_DN528_c0_g1~~TRINITY_DN528_c0_g1_i2.p1  ORF type:complete len:165 (-),score=64.03 TRINITY_DN528_c0_g1_i2:52-546(-)